MEETNYDVDEEEIMKNLKSEYSRVYKGDYLGIVTFFKNFFNIRDNLDPTIALQIVLFGVVSGAMITFLFQKYHQLKKWKKQTHETTDSFERSHKKQHEKLEIMKAEQLIRKSYQGMYDSLWAYFFLTIPCAWYALYMSHKVYFHCIT
jgi:hypothetical protein